MESIWLPIWISLRVALLATVIAYPLGMLLAVLASHAQLRQRVRWLGLGLDVVVLLPLLLPAPVVAYFFLVTLNRSGAIGRLVESVSGGPLLFTEGAAVLASAIYTVPLVAILGMRALERVDPMYGQLARSLGAGEWRVFWRVSLPLASQALVAIGLLAFARAMAEFGITLMVASTVPGQANTFPVALFEAVRSGEAVVALSLGGLGFVLALLFVLAALRVPGEHEPGSAGRLLS
jgi:molybdate transport system permease protein